MSLRSILAGAAAVALSAAATVVPLVASAPPSAAAVCSSQTGVSVVVDFDQLGGGVRTVCLPGGGGDLASQLFPAAGYPLKYAQRQPGFVCRVSDVPASDPCVNTAPADAYWSLWVSDGGSGSTWRYASAGAASLRVSDGQLVAFHWNQGSGRQPPAVAAQRPAPPASTSPSPSPSPGGSGGSGSGSGGSAGSGGSGGSSSGGGSGSGGSTGTGTDEPGTTPGSGSTTGPRDGAGRGDRAGRGDGRGPRSRDGRGAGPSASPTTGPSASASPEVGADESADPTEAPGSRETGASQDTGAASGLPGWVAPGVVGLVAVLAGGVLLARRRAAGRP